jgi:hypothetical protein
MLVWKDPGFAMCPGFPWGVSSLGGPIQKGNALGAFGASWVLSSACGRDVCDGEEGEVALVTSLFPFLRHSSCVA